MRTGIALAVVVAIATLLAMVATKLVQKPFPSDRTPEGAYVRIALGVTSDAPRDLFAYLEQDAQWASYTIRDMRAKARTRAAASYPEPMRTALLDSYRAEAEAPDGADVFVLFARRRGWLGRLRKDMSGVKSVDIDGARATVVTARGTRYPFRKRDNGIWGLTIFTADLLAEAERASRDADVVQAAADDYDRVRSRAVAP
jgi:hypothetical protein